MNLWKDFYENFEPGDSGYPAMPQLIFICEDDRHMAEVFRTIIVNNLQISKINLYFTTDLKQNNDKLNTSLYDFVLDNGKYKVRNIEAKILG